MKRLQLFFAGLIACLAIGGVACTKTPVANLNDEEARVYTTQHDARVNFQTITTFSVADSAIYIENGRARQTRTSLDAAYINALRTGLRNRGFTEVGRTQNPQLALQVNRVVSTQTGFIAVQDYWGFYDDFYGPGYWGPGWGGGAGFGPGWGTTVAQYQVSEGLISIDAFDLRGSGSGQARAVWNGSVRGSGAFDQGFAEISVEALFNQSPYLRKN